MKNEAKKSRRKVYWTNITFLKGNYSNETKKSVPLKKCCIEIRLSWRQKTK